MSKVDNFLLIQLDKRGSEQCTEYENEKRVFRKLFNKNVDTHFVFWHMVQQNIQSY